MIKKIFFTVGAFALVLMLQPSSVLAANSGLQLSPVTINLEVKPGESADGKILITNRNDEKMDFVLEKENFESSSEDGVPAFTSVKSEGSTASLTEWVSFPDGDSGSIEVGKDKEMVFRITVPANAEPGGHYGAVFAKQVKPLIEGGNQIGITARVGALVLVSVPGKVTNGAKVLDIQSPKVVWKGPIDLKMRVQNIGTVHYDSKAGADIKNLLGSATKLDMGTHTILPDGIRMYESKIDKKYPFGYYKITPTATDGTGNIVSGAAVAVWAIPLIIVIPVLIVLILLIIIIMYAKRHFKYSSQPISKPNQES